jgi:hypothetical protein
MKKLMKQVQTTNGNISLPEALLELIVIEEPSLIFR